MKILAICSTINFRNFTRRATIQAIKDEVDELDLLFFTSLKNFFREKITVPDIPFSSYHFWIPDKLKKFTFLDSFEHKFRKRYWVKKFSDYDLIFFTDPNQAWLLPYLKKTKIVYLIRDPNVLQNKKFLNSERELVNSAEMVVATSKNLAEHYLGKYHRISHKKIHYWPNCVDINIWKREKPPSATSTGQLVGIAGNFSTKRTDYSLLDYITFNCPDLNFEIAGGLDYNQSKDFWDKILARKNVKYLGDITFEKLPEIVAGWNVGLVSDKIDEYSSYMHHNKVYQYLALGIPVVSLKIHEDYIPLHPYVILADDYDHYVEAIRISLKQGKSELFKKACIDIASLNSSEVRAREFLSLIKTI